LDKEFAFPPETFTSFGEAIDRYCELKIHRARAGFIHSFSWDGFVGEPSKYKRIVPSADPRGGSRNTSPE
jgi:hypothetical protein